MLIFFLLFKLEIFSIYNFTIPAWRHVYKCCQGNKKLQKFFNLSQNFQTALNVLSVTFTLFAITHIILSSFHSWHNFYQKFVSQHNLIGNYWEQFSIKTTFNNIRGYNKLNYFIFLAKLPTTFFSKKTLFFYTLSFFAKLINFIKKIQVTFP